jgi:hypothetical protein
MEVRNSVRILSRLKISLNTKRSPTTGYSSPDVGEGYNSGGTWIYATENGDRRASVSTRHFIAVKPV